MKVKILIIAVFTGLSLNVFSQSDSLLNKTDNLGRKTGHWIKKYPDGQIMYEGIFKNNHPVGEFKRYDNKGNLQSVLIFSGDGREADATMYHPDGKISSRGKYVNQEKEGTWRFYSSVIEGYLICEENYSHNLRNGLSQKFYPDSTLAEKVNYLNDRMQGEWIQYYPNGQVSQVAHFIEGKAAGKFQAWYEDGTPEVTGQYENDLRDGKWLIYKPDGSVKYEVTYVNGIPDNDQMELDNEKYLDSLENNKGKIVDPEKTGIIK
jgi:antitoxin component YwqK of YwqJK toxin-antitoxin module